LKPVLKEKPPPGNKSDSRPLFGVHDADGQVVEDFINFKHEGVSLPHFAY